MKKLSYKSIIIIIVSIISNNLALCLPATVTEQQLKYGTIYNNETWPNETYIIGDVIIPEEVTVTVEAGSKIIFANYDILKSGQDISQCEIIVEGTFDLNSQPNQPIKVSQINNNTLKILPLDKDTQIIKFYPYKVETDSLRKEFRSFKTKYFVFWSLIYALRLIQ